MGLFDGLFTKNEDKVKPEKKVVKVAAITAPITDINIIDEDRTLYTKVLDEAFEKVNLPGPDFREFFKTLKALENQPLPEQQKYIMAFTGLQVMGLTKDKMIETSTVYLKAVDDEKVIFDKTLEQYNQTEIQAKTKESNRLAEENAKLQKQIQENMTNIVKLNSEVNKNTQNYSTKLQSFNSMVDREKATIQTIVNNIKTYL